MKKLFSLLLVMFCVSCYTRGYTVLSTPGIFSVETTRDMSGFPRLNVTVSNPASYEVDGKVVCYAENSTTVYTSKDVRIKPRSDKTVIIYPPFGLVRQSVTCMLEPK